MNGRRVGTAAVFAVCAGVTTPAATATSLPMPTKPKLPAGTIDPAKLPPADAAVPDDGKALMVRANLVALVLEAAQDKDIDALLPNAAWRGLTNLP